MTQGQGSKCAKCVYSENLLTAVNVEVKFSQTSYLSLYYLLYFFYRYCQRDLTGIETRLKQSVLLSYSRQVFF
jgi:hypothetical protein